MSVNHHSRKQRQLKSLVKKLNILLQKTDADLKSEIIKLSNKIKFLVSQLNGILSARKMKRILGTIALFIGVSFANTANAQWFAYPTNNPFGITPGYTNYIQSVNLIDIDNDGDLDLFTDSLNYAGYYSIVNNFNYQGNIGTATNPNFKVSQINPFNLVIPANDSSFLKLRNFVDMDGDGDYDILVNVVYYGYYSFSSKYRYYENIGSPSSPNFTSAIINPFGLQTSSFIDFSCLGDIDNDGDFDLITNRFDYFSASNSIVYIENTGNTSTPLFGTAQSNSFSIVNPPNLSIPTLVDLDNDSDLDLIYGQYVNYNGPELIYQENIGTNTNAVFGTITTNPFNLTAITFEDMPNLEFGDLDGDSDLDLLGGTYEEVSYFQNVGVQQPITYECINYSCIDPGTGSGTYTTLSACQNSCTPPVTYECDWPGNCYDPGDGSGFYTTYTDCMSDCTPQPTWDCISPGNCQDPGDESGNYWSLQDCQNDCAFPVTWDCDATLGCVDPQDGTGLYASLTGCQANCNSTSVNNEDIKGLNIYPNPVNNTLHISTDKNINKIEIYDALGRIVISENNPKSTINVEQLESGIYSIAILFDDEKIIKRFTK